MTPLTSSSPSAASLSRPTEALQAKAAARRAECCDHDDKAVSRRDDAERSDGPRRSPLLKALVQALREVLAAPTTPVGSAESAATDGSPKAATKAPASSVSTAAAKAAKAAAAGKAADAAGAAEATQAEAPATAAATDVAPTAAGGDALEQALTAFARALMQALRGGDEGHRGRGHHHGHHFGRREGLGWGDDPAQRLDKLASMVAQAALGTTPAKPQPASTTPTPAPASTGTAGTSTAAATDAAATEAAPATAGTTAAPAPAPATLVLEIRLVPGVSSASPWARAANDLVSAFGSLQQALGRTTNSDNEGSVREQLSTFLRNLAARVRGDEAAMSDVEPTRPGALLSVTA